MIDLIKMSVCCEDRLPTIIGKIEKMRILNELDLNQMVNQLTDQLKNQVYLKYPLMEKKGVKGPN